MFTLIISILIFIISFFMILLSSILMKKKQMNRENMTPFECGFNPFNSPRLPFSIKFFLIAIIFLIFDVEITLILPLILTMKYSNLYIWTLTNFIFLIILIIGLFLEWYQGSLTWTN
uniref:NADH dehydrogenase subunit 3 n=1 Tax=Stenochironomus tobaduodecimus TaxID=1636530 RepID=UPI001FAF670B|nr:NADH dehydrogenase subunit 3 [Stenochironomus tobaduodecimus]UKO33039.1 NADH dehydrogenase subunit 3 [Stenochironomus tobaduodecimus]